MTTASARQAEERAATIVEWVAAVAGPLTALTAVLYFFGWTRTNAVFRYFGVDPAILDFELADYLARAAGPAFAPAIGVILGAAVLAAVNRAAFALELACLRHPVTVRGRSFRLRGPSVVLVYVGAVALWCGVRVALGIPDHLGVGNAVGLTEPVPAAVALAAGALLLSTGLRLLLLRPSDATLPEVPVVARLLLVAAILAALFWATAAYSQHTGEVLAAHINDNPATQAETTVYSEQSLDLWSATPPEPQPVTGTEATDGRRYRYTYTGLRLLIYANGRWLLLTGERNASGRLTIAILQDDDTIRVELNS